MIDQQQALANTLSEAGTKLELRALGSVTGTGTVYPLAGLRAKVVVPANTMRRGRVTRCAAISRRSSFVRRARQHAASSRHSSHCGAVAILWCVVFVATRCRCCYAS